MGILIILYILVLGYHYAISVPYEKIKLKRSAGWESYVYLAKHGFSFLIQSLIILFLTVIWSLFVGLIVKLILANCGYTFSFLKIFNLINGLNYKGVNLIYTSFIAYFSWEACKSGVEYSRSKNQLEELRNEDAILNIVIDALLKRDTVKISLKSLKVYIGMIQSEQFERTDLDNITIIPILSGYRDSNDLQLILNCNYVPVYVENGMFPEEKITTDKGLLNQEELNKLDDFRLTIRLSEIESISLFDQAHFNQFKSMDNVPWHTRIRKKYFISS